MGHHHHHDHHGHSHGHHHHHHAPDMSNINMAFYVGIGLNTLFVILEIAAGLWTNSLSLLTDAGHNVSDVASLFISLFAFRLAKSKSTGTFTYGYKKATVLASLVNAVILLSAVGIIVWQAIWRFSHPQPIAGLTVSMVALGGILINSITAYLFHKDKDKDINIKGAYLHLLADALVSLGVFIGGVAIYYTDFQWIDPVLSMLIAAIILGGTWSLLKASLRLTLDGVPENVDMHKVENAVAKLPEILGFHHIHVWALSTTENALTGHLVVANDTPWEKINYLKHELKHKLQHLNIQHITLEVETPETPCKDECAA